MAESKGEYYSLADIVKTTKSFTHYFFRKWWLLLLAIVAGVGLGVVYYDNQKPKYEAVTTFILEEKSAGGGGLAGLASQFGFDLAGLNGGSIFAGDNILQILQSKKVVQQVLLSKVSETGNDRTLVDLYMEFTAAKKNWQKKPWLANISFEFTKEPLSPVQDSVLNVIYNAVLKNLSVDRINKKGTIIKVQVIAANSLFARLMTERLVKEASRLYLDIRVGNAKENIKQLQSRSDSLLVMLNSKSYHAAASQPLDINPGLRTAMVPAEIFTRDKTVLATLYAEVTKNLEMSKLLLSQQTPVIQLLDQPGYLLEDNKKSLTVILLVSLMASVFVFLLVALLFFVLHRIKQKQ